VLWSLIVQLDGAFCYPASQWDARMDVGHKANVWSLRHFELWEDFQAWRGKKINWEESIPAALPGMPAIDPTQAARGAVTTTATVSVAISARTPARIPGARISVAPVVSSRLFVAGAFDVSFEAGDPSLFIGKIRVDNREQRPVAVFSAPEPGSRAIVRQAWTIELGPGKAHELTLWGQASRDGGIYRVEKETTTLSVLVQPVTSVRK